MVESNNRYSTAVQDVSHPALELNDLSDDFLLQVLSYVSLRELCKVCSMFWLDDHSLTKLVVPVICKRWRQLAYNPKLWTCVSLRPEFSGFSVAPEAAVSLASHRFTNQLRSVELPCDLIISSVIHELACKCTSLKHLTLDFSKATQLNDFSELNSFPSNLKQLCICLSEVVFLEGFMRRVYSFLSTLKVLHLIGTLESTSAEEEIFEVVNISKIRSQTPNLTVINLYGVMFIDDSHIDMLANSCIHLEVIAVNYCLRVTGSSFLHLTKRCKKIQTLLLRHTGLKDGCIQAVDWSKCRHMVELDLGMTDLAEETLLEMLTKLPPLQYLSVAHCDFFSDKVIGSMLLNKKLCRLRSLDASHTYGLSETSINTVLKLHGANITGLMLNGKPKLSEAFWLNAIKSLINIRILVLGTAYGWFLGNLSRVHIDQIINSIACLCCFLERLEIEWEPDTIRFSDKSSKFIDLLRMKCGRLQSVTLADGGYYEMVRSNFDRAGRPRVVRPTNRYQTNVISQLSHYNQLTFN